MDILQPKPEKKKSEQEFVDYTLKLYFNRKTLYNLTSNRLHRLNQISLNIKKKFQINTGDQ